mgnify:CR=1 FL=1
MAKPEKTDQGRARARKADKGADKRQEPADTRTRGQVLLSAVEGTVREVAAKAGLGRSAISDWKTGKKVPGDDARATLEQAFGIPRRAWDDQVQPDTLPGELGGDRLRRLSRAAQAATATPSPGTGKAKPAPKGKAKSAPPPDVLEVLEHDGLPTTMAMVDEQLTLLRKRQADTNMTMSEGIRLADAISKLTAQRRRFEESDIDLDKRLLTHPTWVRLKNLLRRLLMPHPALLEELNESLRAWGDEG